MKPLLFKIKKIIYKNLIFHLNVLILCHISYHRLSFDNINLSIN